MLYKVTGRSSNQIIVGVEVSATNAKAAINQVRRNLNKRQNEGRLLLGLVGPKPRSDLKYKATLITN